MNTAIARYSLSALATVLTLGACNARDRQKADTTLSSRMDTAVGRTTAKLDTAARRVESAAGSLVHHEWTDASILAFTAAAGDGEIRESQLATRKATVPAVKAYARQLIADHRSMANDGKTLASKLNVTPDTTNDDVRDAVKHADDDIKDLTDKPAGAEWDRAYIDHEIKDHKAVLDKLMDAAKSTTTPELRAALEKATGKVQEHLTKAQDIKEHTLKK